MNRAHCLILATQLIERRQILKGQYGEAMYQQQTAIFIPQIEGAMRRLNLDNPVAAAARMCQQVDRRYRDQSNETTKQYVMCAALEVLEKITP